MADEKKTPERCNHCNSTNIIFHVWGRSEYWSCKDCKKEVTYVEPKVNDFRFSSWDPKTYGFGSSDFKFTVPVDGTYRVTLPDGITFDTDNLPTGITYVPPHNITHISNDPSITPAFPSISNNFNDLYDIDGNYDDDGF